MPDVTRRTLFRGTAGLASVLSLGGLGACSRQGTAVGPTADAVARAEAARRSTGAAVINARLTPRPTVVDLGGRVVDTWAYGDGVPGPLLRANAGDMLRITVDNRLPTDTSVHWHGIALRNDMDGVPGMTQDPIGVDSSFRYEFTAPDPGTYFYHPHSGVQLDRGLYGVLVVDDPAEPGGYDHEWIVVLDDWIDGTGRTPDDVLADLRAGDGSGQDSGGMGGMDMGGTGEGMQSPLLGGAGDIDYPHYLVNGRLPDSPVTLIAQPGQRVRMRLVNAGSDTAFRVALGSHRMTVTHSDGFPVQPVATDALLIGMGERFDVLVTVKDGAFPLVASAEGKEGHGMAVVRTSSGPSPTTTSSPAELNRRVLLGSDLAAATHVRLTEKEPDTSHLLTLSGSMTPYRWTLNGKSFADSEPIEIAQGDRVRLKFSNISMMFHPMHVHGHTFGLVDTGARKDTVIVPPMQSIDVDFEADNPGQWATHCHNIYHAEAGMMTTLSYQA